MKCCRTQFVAVVICLFCLASGRAAEQQDEALQAIADLGGVVRTIAANTEEKEAYFHLSGTDLTDEGLVHLQAIEQLVWLNLRGTKITDQGLAHLSAIPTLTRIHLERTEVGDAGLAHLAGLENLEYLNLYGTKVSDAGLAHLEGLTQLRKLYLWQSDVTPEGAAALQEKLPELDISLGVEMPVGDDDAAAGDGDDGP